MSGIEFAPFAENIDNVKVCWISHYCSHDFLRLNVGHSPSGTNTVPVKPDRLVVSTEIKPRFVKCYNVVPGSSLLGF
jgi:hypothetical protein